MTDTTARGSSFTPEMRRAMDFLSEAHWISVVKKGLDQGLEALDNLALWVPDLQGRYTLMGNAFVAGHTDPAFPPFFEVWYAKDPEAYLMSLASVLMLDRLPLESSPDFTLQRAMGLERATAVIGDEHARRVASIWGALCLHKTPITPAFAARTLRLEIEDNTQQAPERPPLRM